ncbi:hypothetical protein ZWY2020_014099 [Hordeum vulgare]|nr:hypothetical protein ZWY2020_014099 [Hordeum vulgare]
MVYGEHQRSPDPPLPEGYWGNVCVPVYVALAASDLAGRPLAETASLVRKSKREVDEEYVRSYVDLQELRRGEGGVTAGGAALEAASEQQQQATHPSSLAGSDGGSLASPSSAPSRCPAPLAPGVRAARRGSARREQRRRPLRGRNGADGEARRRR